MPDLAVWGPCAKSCFAKLTSLDHNNNCIIVMAITVQLKRNITLNVYIHVLLVNLFLGERNVNIIYVAPDANLKAHLPDEPD